MTSEQHPVRLLDELVHQRTRLGIMAILAESAEADFSTIRSLLELTPGNLSQHLTILETAKLITIRKTFEGRKPRTWIKATAAGKDAYRHELNQLRALVARFDGPTST